MKNKAVAAPYLIWMGIFIIIPLLIVFYFAFTTGDGSFTFDNIKQAASYSDLLFRSIWLGMLSTIICLFLGFPIGYIIARSTKNAQRTMVLLVMLPMWMNFLLRTYAWMTILENNGILNKLLETLGLGKVNIINTPSAVVLGMVYNFLPFMIMPIYSVMTKIDNRVLEAAQDLGANSFQIFFRIMLPMSIPGIVTGITMVFVPAVSTFVISKILGGGESLIGDVIEKQFSGSTYNPQVGSALSLVLMILVLVCMFLMNQFDDGTESGGVVI